MFPYSFGYALQESVVKIEFGPVVNPIWRQMWKKGPEFSVKSVIHNSVIRVSRTITKRIHIPVRDKGTGDSL